ncbi:GNAT family N-acetyltransferase [Bradyrhizobium macuxiense]|uniref:GNAT family N-acetyltransferase n=1 Tax=Bradyrhizobium macuxiense TaxID=1755647 RepID=UPI000A705A26
MDAAARVHRAAFDQALPWLAGLHMPDEDRWFYRERMLAVCTLWGAFDSDAMSGVIAFHHDWIEQLYVLPAAQGRGIGGALVDIAMHSADRLQLWTFQRNAAARRFYEVGGFVPVEQTDGSAMRRMSRTCAISGRVRPAGVVRPPRPGRDDIDRRRNPRTGPGSQRGGRSSDDRTLFDHLWCLYGRANRTLEPRQAA